MSAQRGEGISDAVVLSVIGALALVGSVVWVWGGVAGAVFGSGWPSVDAWVKGAGQTIFGASGVGGGLVGDSPQAPVHNTAIANAAPSRDSGPFMARFRHRPQPTVRLERSAGSHGSHMSACAATRGTSATAAPRGGRA